jgi:hypothetical protein
LEINGQESVEMKSTRTIAAILVTLLFASAASAAELGIRVGRYHDSGDNFVGAEVVLDLGTLNLNPNIEYSLADDVTAGSVNLDVTFDLGRFATIVPYIGAGLGLAYLDDDFSGSRTDVVGNLIGGMEFELDFLKPYLQVKYFRLLDAGNRGARDDLALTVGLRF